jgi:hypothetical protein
MNLPGSSQLRIFSTGTPRTLLAGLMALVIPATPPLTTSAFLVDRQPKF